METADTILKKLEDIDVRRVRTLNTLIEKHGIDAAEIFDKYLHQAREQNIGGHVFGLRGLLVSYIKQTAYAVHMTRNYYGG